MDWLIKGLKGIRSVLLSLGNVVHSDNDEESLYASCCTQKVAVNKGCHRCSVLAVTVHRYLHEVQLSKIAIAGEWCEPDLSQISNLHVLVQV